MTREQMASFLVRSLSLPRSPVDYFADDTGRPAEADINSLAHAGITAGCGPKRYCPTSRVTRAQMASFLARALRLPAAGRDYFGDDARTPHEGDINRLAEAGITGGCDTGRFCPGATVTRGQMAAFIYRALATATVASTQAVPDPSVKISPSPSPEPSAGAEATPEPSATSQPTPSPAPDGSPGATGSPTHSAEPSASPSEPATPLPSESHEPEQSPSPSPLP
ncbi:MAG: S-layer homology domain-containing protein [Candidatus Limnocylindria bacterium]